MLSCVEPIDLKSIDFEDVLIVEAIVTDEVKYQEIKISRTFSLDEFLPYEESNADVIISDNFQNVYEFQETSNGVYTSIVPFGASSNIEYTLSLITKNGRKYSSKPTALPDSVPLANLYASKEVKDNGSENVDIVIDGFNTSVSSKYFRYEYEETYEIVSPSWVNACLPPPDQGPPIPPEVCAESLAMEKCYKTVKSDSIVQLNTNNYTNNSAASFTVRSIARDNPIIRSRYSILVKQYAQSLEAFTFYKILNKFSSSDNIFSQNQPGFFNGNLYAVDNNDEKVVGYFDISSVSSKRIFFNFSDYFPNEQLPPYFVDCEPFVISDSNEYNRRIGLGEVINFGDPLPGEPQAVVNAPCGDCRLLETISKPDFWVD